MKTYRGMRNRSGIVRANGQPLDPRPDLREHSPTGFQWLYGGSGPAQPALALLAEHFRGRPDGDDRAVDSYPMFKRHRVSRLSPEWMLTSEGIDVALSQREAIEFPPY